MNRRGYLMRDSMIDWAIGIMNDGNVIADFDSDSTTTFPESFFAVSPCDSKRSK
jgi:hypothetical protein